MIQLARRIALIASAIAAIVAALAHVIITEMNDD